MKKIVVTSGSTIEVDMTPEEEQQMLRDWSDGEKAMIDQARRMMSMSFAQLLIGLVSEAWITEADGEAWLAGTLPAPVLLVIDGLPADQRFAAKARALRPSEVVRTDPLVVAMGVAAGKNESQIDAFFTTYSQA